MSIPLKKKKCKSCKEDEYIFKRGMCKSCYIKWLTTTPEGNEYIKKNSISALKKVKSEQTKIDREKKKEVASIQELKKLLEKEINSLVRLIDIDYGCISCGHGNGGNWQRQRHAGHRHSVGSNASIRFNLDNIHVQCSVCNNYLSSNERKYDVGIIERYGNDYLDFINSLPALYPVIKLQHHEYYPLINKVRELIKRIKNGETITRSYCNEYIGIYT